MVVLNKIYTRTGDAGTTALGSGKRVAKTDPRIAAYGTVDETNSAIGLARGHLVAREGDGVGGDGGRADSEDAERASDPAQMDARLERVQNDLFDLGADLCVPDRGEPLEFEPLRVAASQVKWLEQEIDLMNGPMQPLRSFILPGGTPAAAALHMARTICRRAERKIVELAANPDEKVSDDALKYINRLSDFLFVAARVCNDRGRADRLWVPGENR